MRHQVFSIILGGLAFGWAAVVWILHRHFQQPVKPAEPAPKNWHAAFPDRPPKFVSLEKPTDELCDWVIANWRCLPRMQRERVVVRLRDAMLGHPEVMERWKDQIKRNIILGSDDIHFHFTAGMAIRNICRQVVLDYKLPPVTYPDGTTGHQNWDDYYYGALDALAREDNDYERDDGIASRPAA